MNLSYNAIALLRHTLQTTGEKEINEKGQEVNAPRRLNGEEASQRRHFMKATEDAVKEFSDESQKSINEHNELLAKKKKEYEEKNVKKAKEEEKDWKTRIDALVNIDKDLIESVKNINKLIGEAQNKKSEINFNDKVKEVVKKYFKEFGDKVGWASGDDEAVSEIEEILG